VGAPNAGQVEPLERAGRSERAIVTPIPGHHRDLLHQAVNLDGVEITLVDTAGLRESDDPIEQEGVRRAEAERTRADLELEVRDDADGRALPANAVGVARIVVHSKCDLGAEPAREEWHELEGTRIRHVWLSARTGAGLELLRAALAAHAGATDAGTGAFSARARHVAALARAASHIDAAAVHVGLAHAELVAEELRHAQRALDELTGHHGSDELLGEIFASFCIGK
jgi:tRNA modification GTPase